MELNIFKKILKNKYFTVIGIICFMTITNISISNTDKDKELKNKKSVAYKKSKENIPIINNKKEYEDLEFDSLELMITSTLLIPLLKI